MKIKFRDLSKEEQDKFIENNNLSTEDAVDFIQGDYSVFIGDDNQDEMYDPWADRE